MRVATPTSMILGGQGQMAQFFTPYLPHPTALIDLRTFLDGPGRQLMPCARAVRRQAAACLKAFAGRARTRAEIEHLCLLSVPARAYEEAANLPVNARLPYLLGISGRGHSATLFVHQTSIHVPPAEVLAGTSGVVAGIHQLHGPSVTDLSRQTAVLTIGDAKRRHHRLPAARALLMRLLREDMGYGHVFEMTPERHDRLMANIQFLTHSHFLILASALVEAGFVAHADDRDGLGVAILTLVARMGRQPAHVYAGIARENRFNAAVIAGLREARVGGATDVRTWLGDATAALTGVRDRLIAETGMTRQEQRLVSTPMSRVRDALMAGAATFGRAPGGVDPDWQGHVARYIDAIHGDYETWFTGVTARARQALGDLDTEARVMALGD